MARIKIGTTGLETEQTGFGALPVQRVSMKEAVYLLQKAKDGGVEYFDTARSYTDSEEKLGNAFCGMWDKVILATKTPAKNANDFWKDIATSLRNLKTDHIDIYQLHNPAFCPRPGDESGLYDAMLQAKKEGKIRFIGITNHRLHVAKEAVESGLYDTLQFPFSYLSTGPDLEIVQACKDKGVGFIAMKALSGGLITHSAAAAAWISAYNHVIPIWGIQKERELDEFLSYIPSPPTLTDEMRAVIERDKAELQGDFCRGCGYCTPCPQGIEIQTCARASLLLKRSPAKMLFSEAGQKMMRKIEDCVECGHCISQCPYDLNTPSLLKKNYQDYKRVIAKNSL